MMSNINFGDFINILVDHVNYTSPYNSVGFLIIYDSDYDQFI